MTCQCPTSPCMQTAETEFIMYYDDGTQMTGVICQACIDSGCLDSTNLSYEVPQALDPGPDPPPGPSFTPTRGRRPLP